jgi:diguanylate cyclase (GGDEF)-like protein
MKLCAAAVTPKVNDEKVSQALRKLESHSYQLWSISILVALIVGGALLACAFPDKLWNIGKIELNARFLPQFFYGFIALVVLFNIYTLDRQRNLTQAREQLIMQLARTQAAEMLSLLDPLTDIYNRRTMDDIIAREVNHAEKLQTDLTFMMVDADNFKSVNSMFGHLVGDRVLTEIAQILKRTFRNSDSIIRYGGDEFLVVMPETDLHQANRAIERLEMEVERWNAKSQLPGYRLSLSCGVSPHQPGQTIYHVLEMADAKMYQHKNRHLVPA